MTQECVKNCSIEDIKQKLCFINYIINKTDIKKEINETDDIDLELFLKNIEDIFTSEDFDTSKIEKGGEEIIPKKLMTIVLTSTENQKNNKNNNVTSINLGECETLLRDKYNISKNKTLFMKKIDFVQEGIKIPKIQYDIYAKLNGTNLVKLDLSVCENSKVSISIPLKISESENIDKLNSSSGYFNDICYKAKSDSGTDVLLKDRQANYIEGNNMVCQENCEFANYYEKIQIANCSCKVKETGSSVDNMNINKTKLYENFEDNKGRSNLGITSCNVLSSTENIESNTGFFLLLLILVMFIIIFIIFCTRGYNSLENKIDEIIHKKFKDETKNKKNKITNSSIKEGKKEIRILKKSKKKSSKIKSSKTKSLTLKVDSSKNTIQNKKPREHSIGKKPSKILENKNKKAKNSEISNYKPDTDYEFNWLSYERAIKCDKRTNCEYYSSLIRSKQLFIFTFCSFNDYNSGVIKKFMFFLLFALHYIVN